MDYEQVAGGIRLTVAPLVEQQVLLYAMESYAKRAVDKPQLLRSAAAILHGQVVLSCSNNRLGASEVQPITLVGVESHIAMGCLTWLVNDGKAATQSLRQDRSLRPPATIMYTELTAWQSEHPHTFPI